MSYCEPPPWRISVTISSEEPAYLALTLQPVCCSNGLTHSGCGVALPRDQVELTLAFADRRRQVRGRRAVVVASAARDDAHQRERDEHGDQPCEDGCAAVRRRRPCGLRSFLTASPPRASLRCAAASTAVMCCGLQASRTRRPRSSSACLVARLVGFWRSADERLAVVELDDVARHRAEVDDLAHGAGLGDRAVRRGLVLVEQADLLGAHRAAARRRAR